MKHLNLLLLLVFTLSFSVMQAQTQPSCKSTKTTCTKAMVKTVATDTKKCEVKLCDGKPCPVDCCKEGNSAKSAALFINAVNAEHAEKGKVCNGKTSMAKSCQTANEATAQKTSAKTGKKSCGVPCTISSCKGKATNAKQTKLVLAEKE